MDGNYQWTSHSLMKIKHYGLSQQRVKRVIRNPERIEEGIVSGTIACMQRASSNKKSGEIWCMYQAKISKSKFPISNQIQNPNDKNRKIMNGAKKLKVISAWRYPGISPKNNPIPEEILNEIKNLL
jgi:hypothetical protein